MTASPIPLDIESLRLAYDAGADPAAVVQHCLERARGQDGDGVWITLRERKQILADVEALKGKDRAALPLYGIPFAVKDNIDVEGLPTTAACPEFATVPDASAPAVKALRDAGAILLGKTNLDQFATGLVGVRSPFGACRNPFDRAYVSGGSSSGSAVAVAAGVVSFALGTDTAGSGRVPAAFCNIVGWKGTRGLVSTRGVVPACRSLDCVTVFALTCADAAAVASVAATFDPGDAFARPAPAPIPPRPPAAPAAFRLGVPRERDLVFFGNPDAPALFRAAVGRLAAMGATLVEIDLSPFFEAARLLYDGPWVAERFAAVGEFLTDNPRAGHPVVRSIIEGGDRASAVDAFRAQYRLRELCRAVEPVWNRVDAIVTPTAGTIYTIAEVEADPVRLNANLGAYTNFMNLLDYAAVAVPAGFQADGLPFGITLFAPAFRDALLLSMGDSYHRACGFPLGATGLPMPPAPAASAMMDDETTPVAVFGAHMEGLPLNGDLTSRGARLLERTTTAPCYRFYALAGGGPSRPGLIRVDDDAGRAIETEIWALPTTRLGSFLNTIPAPLGLGRVELGDGRQVVGFLCEPHALADAVEISHLGGWRAWLAR